GRPRLPPGRSVEPRVRPARRRDHVPAGEGGPPPLQADAGGGGDGAHGGPAGRSGKGALVKAVVWRGTEEVYVEDVPEPRILNPRDAVVRVRRTAICGSDLHLYDGYIPTMRSGDILGHEFVGEVLEVGEEVTNLSVGDRVVVPFAIACG